MLSLASFRGCVSMPIEPLKPELIQPKRPRPSLPAITDEGKIAAAVSGLPTPGEMQQLAAAVAAAAARDILLGKLQFKSAGEASKVARDFAAIAKDFTWDDERELMVKADTEEDRKEGLAAFRARAQERMKGD